MYIPIPIQDYYRWIESDIYVYINITYENACIYRYTHTYINTHTHMYLY